MEDGKRDEMLIRIDTNVESLVKTVYGNGRPGLAHRMTELEQKVATMRVIPVVIGTLVGTLSGLTIAIIAVLEKV
jgi:hypothetical protein